jgi:hypothetical protein
MGQQELDEAIGARLKALRVTAGCRHRASTGGSGAGGVGGSSARHDRDGDLRDGRIPRRQGWRHSAEFGLAQPGRQSIAFAIGTLDRQTNRSAEDRAPCELAYLSTRSRKRRTRISAASVLSWGCRRPPRPGDIPCNRDGIEPVAHYAFGYPTNATRADRARCLG